MKAWWRALKVRHKVDAVLLLVLVPLSCALGVHLYLVSVLLSIQHARHQGILTREQVHIVRRLAIDIEDAFRGYALTEQKRFLAPLSEAESKLAELEQDVEQSNVRTAEVEKLHAALPRLKQLLHSKQDLIREIEAGRPSVALAYIRSGQGLQLSDALREDLRAIEDRLDHTIRQANERAERLSAWTFIGLWGAVAVVGMLLWASSRILLRSVTAPISRLQLATTTFGSKADAAGILELLGPLDRSGDELSLLAHSSHEMAMRISGHIKELETLEAIGREINTIGPDGLDGVLRRITDRAVELIEADVCLVLLRSEAMGCWTVEAASGVWDEQLRGSIMLWEELPVSVQAFDTRQPAIGEHFRKDARLEVRRRNLIGDSMLAVPLLAQGRPFGVLALLTERPRMASQWNARLAMGMAQVAAVAISNVRLYETVQQKQEGLLSRMRQLEHLAENLAHDLKGPGARMGELVRIFTQQYSEQIDERAVRWLQLMEENGQDIVQRVEGILSLARIGKGQGSVTAVDPALVIGEVVKSHAGEIERLRASVHVQPRLPLVACHGAYLRQVFDNLISNGLKYGCPGRPLSLTIGCRSEGSMACFSVRDTGIGIPDGQRLRVFEPFVRLRQSEAAGSGIGLTIVRRIVDLYGGRVWIEGTDGTGCTVMFTLPWFGAGETVENVVVDVMDTRDGTDDDSTGKHVGGA